MKMNVRRAEAGVTILFFIIFLFFSCSKKDLEGYENSLETLMTEISGSESLQGNPLQEADLPELVDAIARFSRDVQNIHPDSEAFVEDFMRWIFGQAGIPEHLALKVASSLLESPAFFMEFFTIFNQDPFTYYLVDKTHPLPDGYEPDDLVPLATGIYRLGRGGLSLRTIAVDALQEMAEAAAEEGVGFTIGSSYRSAAYQAQVYERAVRNYGKETADRESAQSGRSQHQLGLTVDFDPIDDAFAKTAASHWLLKNAARFGWSLSFPDGYEHITGYRWESWHYRYVGKDLAAFIDSYFDGIQQYALQFIHTWQEMSEE